MGERALLGVGVDVEERGAWARLDGEALRHAAGRWLSRGEREWCAAQSSLAESLVVVLSCKEAAFKAWSGGRPVHEVRLALSGSLARGRALATRDAVTIEVEWNGWGERVVALAVAREEAGAV